MKNLEVDFAKNVSIQRTRPAFWTTRLVAFGHIEPHEVMRFGGKTGATNKTFSILHKYHIDMPMNAEVRWRRTQEKTLIGSSRVPTLLASNGS